MRPDKKGNKKRDERRNGPKTGPQKSTGSQNSSGLAQKSSGPGPKPSGPVQKPLGPGQKPPAPGQKPPVASVQAGDQGPRVLEPAAPPPSEAARYRRREIRSNWHRYEEEPGDEPPPEPDQDFLRGDTFADLLAQTASGKWG